MKKTIVGNQPFYFGTLEPQSISSLLIYLKLPPDYPDREKFLSLSEKNVFNVGKKIKQVKWERKNYRFGSVLFWENAIIEVNSEEYSVLLRKIYQASMGCTI